MGKGGIAELGPNQIWSKTVSAVFSELKTWEAQVGGSRVQKRKRDSEASGQGRRDRRGYSLL